MLAEWIKLVSLSRPASTTSPPTSPPYRHGVVLHRGVSVGAAVDPSTEIVTVADLSKVWVFAEVAEADVHQIAIGTRALLEFPSSGRPPFEAEVDFLYPTLTERTRTLRVRFGADNPSGSLRPGIYGTADFRVTPREALTVGRDAIVDTGVEQHVFVVAGPGKFVPRTVKLGVRLENRIEIRSGLEAEELVVASGVFLIDSESRLRASGGGTGHAGHGGAAKPKASADDSPPGPNAAGDPAPPPAQGHAGH